MKKIVIFLVLSLFILGACLDSAIIIEQEEFDVIVIGSDPEGIAAAISTARNGLNTLLIDHRDSVGGLFTHGWLNFLDMNYSHEGELLTKGIFLDFFNQIEGIAFDIQTARNVFNEMISQHENITVMLNASDITPVAENFSVSKIVAQVDDVRYEFSAKYFIDATQDGDIAAMAGGEYTLGQTLIGGPEYGMAVTQVFKLGGIKEENWSQIRRYLSNDGDPNSGSTHNTAWGFPELYYEYKAKNESVQMRGLNIARQTDGCVMINALQIFAIDPLDKADLQRAKDIAQDELDYVIPFLREYIPGMQDIELLSVAPELYIRESRHFNTEYFVTIDDVMEHRDFASKIALGSYPVDLQGTAPGDDVIILGNPALYSIPIEATIPKGFTNLFIVSKSAGYDPLAHGSIRVVPIGMSVAEGVGHAIYIMDREQIDLREFLDSNEYIQLLQKELIELGAYLPTIAYPSEIESHSYYEGIKLLRSYGLIQGRYNNDYKLEEIVSTDEFAHVFDSLSLVLDWSIHPEISSLNTLTLNNLNELFFNILDTNLTNNTIISNIDHSKPINRGEMAMVFYLLNVELSSLTS